MVKILNFDRKKQVLLKNNKKAFSIAEAFIMLTVASVALAAAAPMITKQIKHNNLSSVQTNILGREIDRAENIINTTNENIREIIGPGRTPEQYAQYVANLEARISALEGVDIESLRKDINGNINSINSSIKEIDTQLSSKADINAIEDLKDKIEEKSIPKGTIAFFNLSSCPTGWKIVTAKDGSSLAGHYPRIAGLQNEVVGTKKEQMVHKHKHVSSQIDDYSASISKHTRHNPSGLSSNVGLTIGTYKGVTNGGKLTYTNDGMNAKDLGVLTCPNRDEGNKTCASQYSADMPLVGNENRPNSVVWLACEKK